MQSTFKQLWEKLFPARCTDRPMELLPKDLQQSLPPLGTLTKNNNLNFHIRFFTHDNNWNWFVTAGEPYGENDFRFYGYVKKDSSAWGTFTLSELEQLRGPMGCPIWRDEHFDQSTWKEYLEPCGLGKWCNNHGFTELAEAVNSLKHKEPTITH